MKFISAVVAENGNTSGPNVSKVFADGIHVAGQRYVAFNIEGRHVYGRQVRSPASSNQVSPTYYKLANSFFSSPLTGQDWYHHRQDDTGHHRCPLRREQHRWQLDTDRRGARRLPRQGWILSFVTELVVGSGGRYDWMS